MKFSVRSITFFLFLVLLIPCKIFSQKWDFIKEKDGIKIYTRKEPSSALKSFKGVADLHIEMSKVTSLLGNAKNFDWWDKNISQIKVLSFEPGKYIQYYLVYDVPWPLADRDLAVDARIAVDPVTGIHTVTAQPLLHAVPEKPGLVRIKNYKQQWTVQPLGKGMVRVILEGAVDPGGNIPAWLYNMVITETPLNVIRELRKRAESVPKH
jgi:hypothetical protein